MARPKSKTKKILFAVEIIVLLLFIGGLYVYGQLNSKLDKINQPVLDDSKIKVNQEVQDSIDSQESTLTGYTTYALFGIDPVSYTHLLRDFWWICSKKKSMVNIINNCQSIMRLAKIQHSFDKVLAIKSKYPCNTYNIMFWSKMCIRDRFLHVPYFVIGGIGLLLLLLILFRIVKVAKS